jgi:hypothetical protein
MEPASPASGADATMSSGGQPPEAWQARSREGSDGMLLPDSVKQWKFSTAEAVEVHVEAAFPSPL